MRRLQATSLKQLAEMVMLADVLEDGHRVCASIHSPEACTPPCAFHAPSDHSLRDAPIVLRLLPMLGYQACRICEHDNEHIDPDTARHLVARFPQFELVSPECPCGCCPEVP